ncbi:MAG: hypothetical protein EU539_10510 [Promethearchaeota archaeon]|nr:MAG: hypothetical protein EU539_10510 [Candidatus Lokiarchaeota archaeon]
MTAQIPDSLIHEGEEFSIVGVRGKGLYRPEDFGMNSYSRCTACWRGHVMRYILIDDNLVLDRILLNAENPPNINGVEPQKIREVGTSIFDFSYNNLNLKANFTGGILLAKDFIDEMYVHMGFQRPIAYRTVIEIKLENGFVISTRDLSKKMEEYRYKDSSKGAKPLSNSSQDIENWIKSTFSLDY